jgi:uncharacterized protein
VARNLARVVLDTNVLLVSVSDRSPLHWVFARFLNAEYYLCVTTEILNEYAEILSRHMGSARSQQVLDTMLKAPNILLISPAYRFNLLTDPDDNKFVDCAIAANAVCIVSHDRDFLPLRDIEFPKVAVVDTEVFRELLFSPPL